MEQLKKAFRGDEDDAEQGIMGDVTSLSWSTRIKGFVFCFSLGILLSFMGTFLLFLPNGLKLFALFYSLGNIVSLGSTFFLMGPLKQAKRMCAETRAIAAIIMVVCIGLTLCAALWWKITILAILFCAFQFAAMTWYSLSYIPFARDAVKNCFGACFA